MSDWTGDQEMVEMLRRAGALDEADAIFDALDEAERTGDYELVSDLLGPMLSPAQVRERLTELRRTPENVEEQRLYVLMPRQQGRNIEDRMRAMYATPPENVECPR